MKDQLLDGEYLITKEYTDWHIKTGGFARDMTMRDYFAAQTLTTMFYPAIINSMKTDVDLDGDELAGFAYIMADAMLQERAK